MTMRRGLERSSHASIRRQNRLSFRNRPSSSDSGRHLRGVIRSGPLDARGDATGLIFGSHASILNFITCNEIRNAIKDLVISGLFYTFILLY
jgi:hypothetical protein